MNHNGYQKSWLSCHECVDTLYQNLSIFQASRQVSRKFWYSFDRPRKNERLSLPWSQQTFYEPRTFGLVIQRYNH